MSSSDSDLFAECRTKEEAIGCYLKRLEEIKGIARREYGIEASQFDELFRNEFLRECATPIPIAHSKHELSQFAVHCSAMCLAKYAYSQLRRYVVHIAVLAVLLILVNYSAELTRIFMRNIQAYIYPAMRLWRILTMPIIRQFPQLSQLYDETCLISNPFFRVANLDCSPCADVINVVDLTIAPHFDFVGSNIPHIIQQVDGTNKSVARIHELYQENRKMFRSEADRIRSSDASIANLDQLFDVMLNKSGKTTTKNIHILWRINRMTPGRMLRALFPAPKAIPEHAGIDIERYVAFDMNGGVTYQLPSTDCSNMFIHQAIGSRIIQLKPTAECQDECRRITIKLKENHTLFYDWWYWKPVSLPAQQLIKTTTVSYIGSYCM